MSKYEKGQMFEITFQEGNEKAWWEYAVVKEVFDNQIELQRDSGGRYMHVIAEGSSKIEQPIKIDVVPLYKDSKKVFSKRSFFGLGSYTFEPTTKGGK